MTPLPRRKLIYVLWLNIMKILCVPQQWSIELFFPALEWSEAGSRACAIGTKAGELLGLKVEEAFEPTATDANWFCYFGVPAVDASARYAREYIRRRKRSTYLR